ncbi:hypothetical protein [Levilactobacillus parabrevis]|uniref:hypothetical protein n=1 Tax=Levilactobacillus parabrevis TaxID=357278 RepID=UPI003756D237
MKRKIMGVAVTLAVAGLGLWSNKINAQAIAAPTYGTNAAALAGAPQGVDLSSAEYKDYFKISNDVSGVTGKNVAKVMGSDDGVGSPAGTGNSVIQISKAGSSNTNTWGSIWSADKTFDLTQPETASMWIYTSGENASSIGDGMAFVLQNDGDGVNAFSGTKTWGSSSSTDRTVDVPGKGESMGVWGVDPEEYTKNDLSTSAIQKSWALEFDTHSNVDTPPATNPMQMIVNQIQWDLDDANPASFDLGKYYNSFDSSGDPTGGGTTIPSNDNHIASNYPGKAGTYSSATQTGVKTTWSTVSGLFGKTWQKSPTDYYYYKMQHLGYLGEGATGYGMSDHRWHHITLDYTPPTSGDVNGKMKYTFNDKDPETGLAKASTDSTTVPIKLSAFGDTTKVRWGFTGSTGEETENNLVAFDQIPGEAETSATAKLSTRDDAGNYTAVDGSASTPTISGGTPVKLEYTFKRDGGLKDWKNVNASLTIPKSIQLSSGRITNPDGSDGGSVDISKLNGTELPVALGSDGNGVTLAGTQEEKITLYGTTSNVDTTEDSTTSYFQGTNASSTAKLTGFNIGKSKLSMDIDTETLGRVWHVNYGGKTDAKVIGVVVPTDKSVKPADITIHPTLNGVAQDTFKQGDDDHYDGNYGTTGFHYTIPNSKLKAGSNTVSFYATDNNPGDGRSPVVSTEVIAGTVDLGDTSEDMSFGNMTLTGSGADTTLKRDNDWGLDVIDSRAPKSGNWQLYAYADPLTTDPKQTAVSTTLDGYLVYPSADGIDKPLGTSPATATPVASGAPSGDDTTKTTNIAQNWTDNSGIRLVIKGGASAGNYSGAIHWTFVNSAG